jgi:hypothetical protein
VGGSARAWSTQLAGRLVPGTVVTLHVVMTKFGPPPVTIGYDLSVH